MAEKMEMLNEDDLDGIVGGAFNQKVIDRLGLEVKTSRSGAQALIGTMQASTGSLPGSIGHTGTSGIVSERGLRSALESHDKVAVSAKTTSGEMKALTKDEISELLS